MGVYNPSQKEYFFRAVLSIVHQSFQDWELILYDDGSAKPYEKIIIFWNFIRNINGSDQAQN